jgi:hypothetical protein
VRLALPPHLESLAEVCEADVQKVAKALESEDACLCFAQRRSFTRRGAQVKESYLDVVIRDVDTTAVLLRKEQRAGGTDPRTGRPILPLSDDEAQRVFMFKSTIAPRALRLLRLVAGTSNFLADLAAGATRALLTLFEVPELQTAAAVVLETMTQPEGGRRKVADALSREAAAVEALCSAASKPAETDALVSAARKAMELGMPEVQSLLAELAPELGQEACLSDLALNVLANSCLEPRGKSAVQKSGIYEALKTRLNEPGANEKVAGLVTNLVGTDAAGMAASDKLAPIVLPSLLRNDKVAINTEKVLSAVQNVALTSAVGRSWLIKEGKIALFRAHFGAEGTVGLRCATILAKLAQETQIPNAVPVLAECQRVLTREAVTSPHLDQVVRLTGVLVTRGGGVDALVREEDNPAVGKSPCATLSSLMKPLMTVIKAVKPKEYGKPGELSLLRGNLALIIADLATRQGGDCAPAVAAVDLKPAIGVMIECLRKEVGPVQKNCGVALTQIARVERYKSAVRSLNGFESLHQIQLANQVKTDESIPAAFRR